MTLIQQYDRTIWPETGFDATTVLGEPASGYAFAVRLPHLGAVQIDGVCPRCGRWHTVALRNGFPSCFVTGNESARRIKTKGGVQ